MEKRLENFPEWDVGAGDAEVGVFALGGFLPCEAQEFRFDALSAELVTETLVDCFVEVVVGHTCSNDIKNDVFLGG